MNGRNVSIGVLLLAAIYFAVLFARGLQGGAGLTTMTDFGFYLLFPAVVEVVLITVLLYKPRYRPRCALFFLSIALPLFAGEIVLELTAPTKEGEHADQFVRNQRAAEKLGVPFDARSKFEVITQLRDEGILAYPMFSPQLIRDPLIVNGKEVRPLAGISGATTVVGNEGGEYLVIKSDEHGFNNPQGFHKLKQADIAIVGDSIGFGECVRPGRDAVSLLRSAYPRTVNFSISGDGPLCELATIREFVEPVRPRVLVWFYSEGTDLDDLEREKQDALLMKYLDRSAWQGLANLQRGIDEQLVICAEREIRKMRQEKEKHVGAPGAGWTICPDIAQNCFNRIRLSRLRGRLHELAAKCRRKHDYDLKLLRKILASARDQAYRHGVFYFVYLPSWSRFYESGWSLPDAEAERERVLALVADLAIPIIDIAMVFEKHQDPLELFPFRLANHYNEQGHRIVAEALKQRIRRDLGQSLLCRPDQQE